jgi:hypothetical protein
MFVLLLPNPIISKVFLRITNVDEKREPLKKKVPLIISLW